LCFYLLELQSWFASDKRFALDERFYVSDGVLDDTYGTVKTAAGAEDERRRQLEILQDVLGYQIRTKDDKKDKYKLVY
jgi:pyruvate kinase